jgi:5-methylcytosine-specific restriction protein B
LLDWYLKRSLDLNREQLERYKRLFLAHYTDFEPMGFAATQGGYFAEERTYKDALIERARSALTNLADQDDAVLGGQLLDILTGKAGVPSDLLGWRTNDRIKALRAQHPDVLEREAGRLVRADDVEAAISNFVETMWPILMEDQSSKPYSESRNIPTMLAALVHPARAYGINTDPVSRFARALTGEPIMGWNPLTPKEYADVLALMARIRDVMKNEWNWDPRDLWDVQGFVWAVHRPDQPKLSDAAKELGDMEPFAPPTNLILYGPPGTGKTYATAREAVQLCNGSAPESREELMAEYIRL